MTAPDGKIRIPLNEESRQGGGQIEEYLMKFNGEGIQHIALICDDLLATVDKLALAGVPLMTAPTDSYYEMLTGRLPGHGQPVAELQTRGILMDGTTEEVATGGAPRLLLQIFSQTQLGPVFFEFIQRKGDEGFGEGNFKALFESLERDQVKRGVIEAKHGLAAGDAQRPARADWTIDQAWAHYSAAEHGVWRTLFERQSRLLPGRACDAFVQGMADLPIGPEQIPDFRHLSDILMARTGWQVVAVPGLVPDEVFFEHLAHRRFPAGQFIRQAHELDYIEEPDVFGHVPLLLNPAIADYIQAYGVGGLRAQKLGVLDKLARVYWYTIEFGLVQQPDGLRIYGAGIASSAAESVFALADASPNRVRFDLERVMRTRYRIDDFQETYFVIDGLDQLLELASIDFSPLYARVQGQAEYEPGTVLVSDRVISKGTGRYHAAKR